MVTGGWSAHSLDLGSSSGRQAGSWDLMRGPLETLPAQLVTARRAHRPAPQVLSVLRGDCRGALLRSRHHRVGL